MHSLKQLRRRKRELRRELDLNKKDIQMDFMSLKWSLLFDLGMDLAGIIISKLGGNASENKKEDSKPEGND